LSSFSTEELYEQAKRVLRQTLPAEILNPDDRPFIMACHECGLPFRNDVEMGMVAEHARAEHGIDPETGSLTLDLIFVGEGPPPEPGR
jgi:hypothetical protein